MEVYTLSAKRIGYYKYRLSEEWKKSKLHLARLLVRQINPFRYLWKWKAERLYDGYLNDRRVAENFRERYLPEEFRKRAGGVLDFGCGRGRHCAMLSQCGFEVIGMDKVRNDYWKKMPSVRFIEGDDNELKTFKSGSFDMVVSFLAIYFIKNDQEVLNQFYRVLREGGYLILQLPNQNNLKTAITHKYLANDPLIIRYYTVKEASLKLETAGFKAERVWMEKFYSPYLTGFFGYILEILLPHQVSDFASRLTPPKYRGLINITARKVSG